MEPLSQAFSLLKRHAELETECQLIGAVELSQERQLYSIRLQLEAFPRATAIILAACEQLHRRPDALTWQDVESYAQR